MSRINVYAADEYGDPGTEFVGWFNLDKAESWVDRDYERTGYGTGLYRTSQGRWVFDGETGRCMYITPDEAREWLLANKQDDAVERYFGEIEEERGPGRPRVGEQVCFTAPAGDLAAADAIAEQDGISRSAVMRAALAAYVTGDKAIAHLVAPETTETQEK
jgi:hypothetical protein